MVFLTVDGVTEACPDTLAGEQANRLLTISAKTENRINGIERNITDLILKTIFIYVRQKKSSYPFFLFPLCDLAVRDLDWHSGQFPTNSSM